MVIAEFDNFIHCTVQKQSRSKCWTANLPFYLWKANIALCCCHFFFLNFSSFVRIDKRAHSIQVNYTMKRLKFCPLIQVFDRRWKYMLVRRIVCKMVATTATTVTFVVSIRVDLICHRMESNWDKVANQRTSCEFDFWTKTTTTNPKIESWREGSISFLFCTFRFDELSFDFIHKYQWNYGYR